MLIPNDFSELLLLMTDLLMFITRQKKPGQPGAPRKTPNKRNKTKAPTLLATSDNNRPSFALVSICRFFFKTMRSFDSRQNNGIKLKNSASKDIHR